MKTSNRVAITWSSTVRLVAVLTFALFALALLPGAAHAAKSQAAPPWSVQVEAVQAGDIALPADFRMAIYEELVSELIKNKQFDKVYRDGDHNADSVPNLLILKTTMRKFSQGNETQRAVTTVSGWTKLNVRSQLFTRDGKLVLEYFVDGSVRFMGSNLHATHILAHNVAVTLKRSTLPDANSPTATGTGKPAGQ
jgi:hypothetical protein